MAQISRIILIFFLIGMTLAIPSTNSGKLTEFKDCLKRNFKVGAAPALVSRTNNNLTSTLYQKLNYQWNLRKDKIQPMAYFIPKTTQDVQVTVQCASKSGIPLVPKSGGHSYESFSFGTPDSIIIDFRSMDSISVNQSTEIATIQPGALIGQINGKLWSDGGFGIPMGNCPTVGIGGHALGGGIGLFGHMFGLALDNIVELKMVDAQGSVQTVSKSQNPDLFWALRGIGSGYIGIVTEFKFKLFKASALKITFVRIRYDLTDAGDVLKAWQSWLNWVKDNESKIHSAIWITGTNFKMPGSPLKGPIEFHTIHIQDASQPKSNANFLKNLQIIWPKSKNISITYPSYIDFTIETAFYGILTNKTNRQIDPKTLRDQTIIPRYNQQHGFYVDKMFNDSQPKSPLKNLAQVIQNIPQESLWILILSEGGALHEPSSKDMAYVHRKSLYSISANYDGSTDKKQVTEGRVWFDQFLIETKEMDSGESYQNYVDDDRKDYLKRYYSTNLQRLIDVKKKWDPRNYFRNPQSVPLSGTVGRGS